VSTAATGSLRGWGAGARVAGSVIALGYLLGLVQGPVLAVAGGLALVTLGRCAASAGSDDLLLGAALAVVGGALQVGGLRWETLDLAQLRGAQAVLGPTVLVDPSGAAAACWLAATAATAALAVWLATARRIDEGVPVGPARALWYVEALVGALAIVSVFWGASIPRGSFGGSSGALAVAEWLLAVGVVGGAATGAAVYLARVPALRGWTVASAAAGVLGAAAVVATAVP
jgi:hypothetical protein